MPQTPVRINTIIATGPVTSVNQVSFAAPDAASATVLVNNVTTVNGALTVAAQPDVARPFLVTSAPGSPGITGGTLTCVYVANDGTLDQTDVFSLVGHVTSTPTSTKGCLHLSSATVSGLVGGTSPTIQIGTNASLAVPIQPFTQAAGILKEGLDGEDVSTTDVGTLTAAGIYTPHTAPNASHVYLLDYTLLAPAS